MGWLTLLQFARRFKKQLAVVALVLVLVAAGVKGWHYIQDLKQQRVIAELRLVTQKQLNDSTVARLAVTEVQKDSLSAALDAAKQLNGKLVAGARIKVPKRDTTVENTSLPTTTTTDSARVATFRDSTFAGVFSGTVTAPKCCAPLELSYSVTRPEFRPTVSVVQVADRHVWTVTWQGERVNIEAPFVAPPERRPGALGGFVEANVDHTGKKAVEAGGLVRLPLGLRVQGAVEYELTSGEWRGKGGVRKEF